MLPVQEVSEHLLLLLNWYHDADTGIMLEVPLGLARLLKHGGGNIFEFILDFAALPQLCKHYVLIAAHLKGSFTRP